MESETAKPTLGTWDRLPTTDDEHAPKVTFQVNVPEKVHFLEDTPIEREGDNGAYYTFKVKHNYVETVIQTSSWTLLAALKKHSPLKGKELTITKKLNKTKQYFVVE